VRFLVFLITLICPLQAELVARFHTTQGLVDVVLQYTTAPQAVASFITLAQGSRPWVDSSNGRIRTDPFYNGIKIHRTANDSGFKFAQGGSPKGDGSDGPGYTFKDEFSSPLTHVPYVLSMANAGPNTNGSQFFFTGSLSQPTFNNVHTIFGLVTDPASRLVVDAMIAAGPNGTTINEVTITRTDAGAIAFNEQAQNLPAITCPGGSLTVNRGLSTIWNFNPLITTGEVFHAYRSTTMAAGSWEELDDAQIHVGISKGALLDPVAPSAFLDNASAPSAFYNLYVASHPGSVAPSYLNNRTVTIPLGGGILTYVFDPSGISGTTTYTPSTGSPLGGPFTTVNPNNGAPLPPSTNAHSFVFTADTPSISPRYLWIKVGCDSATNSLVTGRHSTQNYDGILGWRPFSTGSITVTR
jgi:peptidyl-prolyl cis-trans isomerase A (cyclophilin A)